MQGHRTQSTASIRPTFSVWQVLVAPASIAEFFVFHLWSMISVSYRLFLLWLLSFAIEDAVMSYEDNMDCIASIVQILH